MIFLHRDQRLGTVGGGIAPHGQVFEQRDGHARQCRLIFNDQDSARVAVGDVRHAASVGDWSSTRIDHGRQANDKLGPAAETFAGGRHPAAVQLGKSADNRQADA